MPDEVITLEFLAGLCQQTLREMRALRSEVAELRTLMLQGIASLAAAVDGNGRTGSATMEKNQ
jgi:ActR/RegA family two-component response regulator